MCENIDLLYYHAVKVLTAFYEYVYIDAMLPLLLERKLSNKNNTVLAT